MAAVANASTFRFVPLSAEHLPLVERWLRQPHVARWYDAPETALRRIEGHIDEPEIDCFLVELDNQPLGYIQIYDPHAYDNHPYRDQPRGTRGVDQFIGDGDLIGRGYGPAFIDQLVRAQFASGAPRIVTDPDPSNASAIRAYRKAGFCPVEERQTPWGHVLLMARISYDHRIAAAPPLR